MQKTKFFAAGQVAAKLSSVYFSPLGRGGIGPRLGTGLHGELDLPQAEAEAGFHGLGEVRTGPRTGPPDRPPGPAPARTGP